MMCSGYSGAMNADPGRSLRGTFPAAVGSVRAARHYVQEAVATLAPHTPAEIVQNVVLATSELFTNAVTHGHGTEIGVGLERRHEALLLEVTSELGADPVPTLNTWVSAVPEAAQSGRGLMLVSKVSNEVVTHADHGLLCVQCRFNLGAGR